MPPRKIVCLITLVEKGGAQLALTRLAQGLRQRGHDAQAWAIYHKGQPTDLPFDRVLLSAPPTRRQCAALPGLLMRELRQARPDALVTFMPLACVVGQCAAWLSGVRHRVASQRNLPSSFRPVMRRLDRWVGSTSIYTANVAVSAAVRDAFADYPASYRAKLRVVHNALMPARPLGVAAQAMRLKLGVPAEAFVLVATGRLVHQKNHGLLIQAIAPLPGVHLVVAGEGDLRDALLGQADALGVAGRVHLPGALPYQDIPSLLVSADAYVMPSRHEGLSNALLEAMQSGKPLLVSDIPTQLEAITDRSGRLAGVPLPAHDARPWTSAIERLMTDDEWRRSLAEASLRRATDFTLDAMVDGFEASLGWQAAGQEVAP